MININKLNQNNNYTLGKPTIKTIWSNIQWSKTMQSSGDMGKIIPVDIKEMLPSERYTATYNPSVQFTPFVTNLLHEVTGELYTGFVPNRLIMDRWQEFITGTNEEGEIINEGEITIPRIEAKDIFTAVMRNVDITDLTEWKEIDTEFETKTNVYKLLVDKFLTSWKSGNIIDPAGLQELTQEEANDFYENFNKYWKIKIRGNKTRYLESIALFDYLEYPLQIVNNWNIVFTILWLRGNGTISGDGTMRVDLTNKILKTNLTYTGIVQISERLTQNWIIDLPFKAYNKFYNDWVRNFDYEPKRNLTDKNIAVGKWSYDMYTRARRYQLRGAMPSVPVEIPELSHTIITRANEYSNWESRDAIVQIPTNSNDTGYISTRAGEQKSKIGEGRPLDGQIKVGKLSTQGDKEYAISIAPHGANGTGSASFNLFDFLTAGAIMNYYCNNAKIKPRYGEQLWARWGVSMQDARLQLAEFVNAQYFNITQNGIIQTSAQTSADSTLQGNITGQMWGNGQIKTTYEAQEHGYLITLMLIKPKNSYERGVNPLLQKVTKWDYATPELANIPDRPIFKKEIAPMSDKDAILGYKSIYDEYRTDINTVTGILRPSVGDGLGAHTLARLLPNNVTMQYLTECIPDTPRIKQFTEQPDFIFSITKNIVTHIPLPYETRPELNM